MVPEGEEQPDNPEQRVLLEVQKSSKIACGSYLEKRQQDHFGSPMAAGARSGKRRERGKERRGKQSDERGRRGGSSETCQNDKPGF